MAGTRHVALVAFPDVQILDVTGPLEVFARTARLLREGGRRREAAYRVELLATKAGPLVTSSGLRLVADRGLASVRDGIDTLLVAGGAGTAAATRDARLLHALRRLTPHVRRLGSVCSGTFILATAGLLDGRRVTTHWRVCAELARRFPMLTVDPDPIFVRDGNVYTSA
jgi:transcriptional regulator GlxA family with amidase domain